ncbi:MAG: hypothetical protein DCC75_03355, partial [Proteobacteria bacterium]
MLLKPAEDGFPGRWVIEELSRDSSSAVYQAKAPVLSPVKKLIFTSAQTRAICNDPFVAGVRYTSSLREACGKALALMSKGGVLSCQENSTTVLHILRGGLNFGLREAVADAFGWNNHASAFVSAQRARKKENPQDWIITESDYQKLSLRGVTHVIFGDVVATGTSLEHALHRLLVAAEQAGSQVGGITFFTIGSPRSHSILEGIDRVCREKFKSYTGSQVVYLEGIFACPTVDTPLTIKIDGTDLIRRDSLLAPEFVKSQYEDPAYPLERCTIYDAGSRAFDLVEYFHDVKEYWQETMA